MSKLRQLTPQDVMFVGGENSKVYQHTAGLIMLDASDSPGFCFDVYRRHLQERLSHIPQFHWKLHEVPLGLDLPYWVQDENFSFDHHIRRIAVPSPGDRAALTELVSYLYCKHMDRNRPLWEAWFIEGLADGQYAVLQKQHHCMMDGEGASKLVEAMCDLAPNAAPRKVDAHIENARPGEVPEAWRMSLTAAGRLSQLPLRVGREIYGTLRHSVWARVTQKEASKKKPHAPNTFFNGDIGRYRGLVFASLSLADVKTIKEHFGVTVNEVVLALVGSSMRDYLLAQGSLPDEALRTSIPVSLRTASDDEFSNRVTLAAVSLATDLADPAERIRVIAADAEVAKEQAHSGGRGMMEIVQLLPPVLINAMLTMAPPEQVTEMAGVNLVVSSVRGSDKPMYIGGARMTATYPMSIITPGGGINITCVSYAGKVDVGITIDPDKVPEPWSIIDGLHRALEEYVRLAGGKTPVRKKAQAKKKTPARKKTAARKKAPPRKKAPASKQNTTRPRAAKKRAVSRK